MPVTAYAPQDTERSIVENGNHTGTLIPLCSIGEQMALFVRWMYAAAFRVRGLSLAC